MIKQCKAMQAVACIGLILSVTVTGCGKKDMEASTTTPVAETIEQAGTQEETENSGQSRTDAEQESLSAPEQSGSENDTVQAEQEYISGKVKELKEDGFLFSQTVVSTDFEGGGSFVTILDEGEAEEISVKYTPETNFEHWTISGGGADIVKKEASASDITEGMGLEINGYFEGSDFIAKLVIIEVYE